jgi:TrmH family RNA methyltransferase
MIISRDNATIKAAKRLLQRKGRVERGAVLIEGARLIGDAWRAGIRPERVFIQPDALRATSPAPGMLEEMAAASVALEEVSDKVFAELVETVTPQGIAAVVAMPSLGVPAQPTLLLALDGVRDPGNAGTLLRSAEAVGVEAVLFGPDSVDPWNGKVVRAAMGAHFRLPIREVESWREAEAFAGGLAWYVAAGEAPHAYDAIDWLAPSILVVGNEATGASAEVRQRATPIAIPMLGATESLNAAMAGTVILFEAARQRR